VHGGLERGDHGAICHELELYESVIHLAYDDGCNEHQTVSPVAAAPFVVWNRPETSVGSYNDVTTLMACFKGRG
jgi:hypothetical protein